MMVRYELKKIFGSRGSKIALLLLVAAVVLACWMATSVEWVNEQGDHETGHAAVTKLRAARKEWAGPLDTERLTAALLENQRINATPEAQSNDYTQHDIAYSWKQGIDDIRMVLNYFLTPDFFTFDYFLADNLSVECIPGIYEHRVQLLKDALYAEDTTLSNNFTDSEKAWIIAQYRAMETPMQYDYFKGWMQVSENSVMLIMLYCMILGYLVAGIFSNEFKWKADSIYFSSALGKTVNTRAKIMAGFLLVTVTYWVCMLTYTLYTLCYLGIDGWNCPIQLDRWKSFYNVTFLERHILILFGGYLGNLFIAFLAMWISARTKTALIAVTLPFMVIFLPNMLQNFTTGPVAKILGLLPDRLLQINYAMNYFDVYSIGNAVAGAIPVLFAVYLFLTSGLIPAMYREFHRKQIK